jgi:hypothetical protein
MVNEAKVLLAVARDVADAVNAQSYFFRCNSDYDIHQNRGWPVSVTFQNRNMAALGTHVEVFFKENRVGAIVNGQYRNSTKDVADVTLGDPELGESVVKMLDEIGMNMVMMKRSKAEKIMKRTANVIKKFNERKEK